MIYNLGNIAPEIADDAYVAPSAIVIGDVKLLPESSLWFGTVLRGDIETITVGRGTNVQDGTVMHTDPDNPCTLGDYVTVGHMAMLHGCTVGDGSLIGIGATMLNGSKVGRNCIVGAHTLITEGKVFPDGVLIMGTPGKVVRELSEDDFTRMRANADRYITRAQHYKKELQPR